LDPTPISKKFRISIFFTLLANKKIHIYESNPKEHRQNLEQGALPAFQFSHRLNQKKRRIEGRRFLGSITRERKRNVLAAGH